MCLCVLLCALLTLSKFMMWALCLYINMQLMVEKSRHNAINLFSPCENWTACDANERKQTEHWSIWYEVNVPLSVILHSGSIVSARGYFYPVEVDGNSTKTNERKKQHLIFRAQSLWHFKSRVFLHRFTSERKSECNEMGKFNIDVRAGIQMRYGFMSEPSFWNWLQLKYDGLNTIGNACWTMHQWNEQNEEEWAKMDEPICYSIDQFLFSRKKNNENRKYNAHEICFLQSYYIP